MKSLVSRRAILTLGLAFPAFAQLPVINPGGVVNAASFVPASQPGHEIAPGSIAAIFGVNLATSTVSATGVPLPTTLGGTSVTINGLPAPLFFVSPNQINFEVPSKTATATALGADLPASVVVTTAVGTSDSVSVDIAQNAPGLFTQTQTGCGAAAVLNVAPNGDTSLNTPSNSAAPGQFLSFFGTGLGYAYHLPPDGYAAPVSPLPSAEYGSDIGFEGGYLPISYDGRAPGLVGVDQVNTALAPYSPPVLFPQGCNVPVTLTSGYGSTPQQVTISVHTGGGQCQNPPIGSGGLVTIQKSVVLNDPTFPESDTLTAAFSAEPAKQSVAPFPTTYLAPCAIPGYSYLSAGTMFIAGPGLPNVAIPASAPPAIAYSATLPPGSISTGTFDVSATGGADVGFFVTRVDIGPGIQVTSQFPKGSKIPPASPLTVSWAGAALGLLVTVHLISHSIPQYDISMQVLSGEQSVTFPFAPETTMLTGYELQGSDDLEIEVDAGPDPSEPLGITPTGLTLGGQIQWNYQYRFVGLIVP